MPAIKTHNIQSAVTHFLQFPFGSFHVAYQIPQIPLSIDVISQNSHKVTAI